MLKLGLNNTDVFWMTEKEVFGLCIAPYACRLKVKNIVHIAADEAYQGKLQ